MPKRQGHVYDTMWQWETLKEADRTACKRKKNYGVRRHSERWLQDLVEVQRMIVERRMRTDAYTHETLRSGHGKVRDIAKLDFMPNHIAHQCLVIAGHGRMDKYLIPHTYASRKGYGQVAAALQLKKWLKRHADGCRWYAQGDIVQYYANINHGHLRTALGRLFKDREFVDAYMEPFARYADGGVGIPLGIRPSQDCGNLALSGFDRHMKDKAKAHFYMRYLDDFVVLGRTKGEVKRMMRMAVACLQRMGFDAHEPKIRPITEGLDFLGYVFYDGGGMYWRKSDKKRWLRHRSRLSNPRRTRELDMSAWGMVKWGNRHCRRLFRMVTGISMEDLKIKLPDKTDSEGRRIIDAPKITTTAVVGSEVEFVDWVKDVETSYGKGRYALEIVFFGKHYKLIANSVDIKAKVDAMDEAGVTRFAGVIYDKGGNHFDISDIDIRAVGGRAIEMGADGAARYKDNGDKVTIGNNNK